MSKFTYKKDRQLLRREARAQFKENGEKYMKRTRQIIRFLIFVVILEAVVILCSGCVLQGLPGPVQVSAYLAIQGKDCSPPVREVPQV